MKREHQIRVSQLSDLPAFKAVKTYDPSDFTVMTKQELINLIPSGASISWSRPQILEEVSKAYDHAKQYFDKHAEGLSRLRSGQLCLVGPNLDLYMDDQPVYLLTGLWWLHHIDTIGYPVSGVQCDLQELAIKTHWDDRLKSLSCRSDPYNYDRYQKVYPISQAHLQIDATAVEHFKEALNFLTPHSA